jgi:beta-glucosidase-like glycosyl hydrolase
MLVKNDEEVRTQSFFAVKQAVEKGELTEEQLTESVRHVLNMKYDQGLFDDGGRADPDRAARAVGCAEHRATAVQVAQKAVMLLRDRDSLLPLSPEQKVLVMEQMTPNEFTPNDVDCNSHVLNEAMLEHSRNVINATTDYCATEPQEKLLLEVAQESDVVVVMNGYWRLCPRNNTSFIRKLVASGRKVIVLTNVPYAFGCPSEASTIVCTFAATPPSLRAAARLLYGKAAAAGRWPLSVPMRDLVDA